LPFFSFTRNFGMAERVVLLDLDRRVERNALLVVDQAGELPAEGVEVGGRRPTGIIVAMSVTSDASGPATLRPGPESG
jgi:hypothetical protein